MLPDWFNDWNSRNKTDIYGPAIIFGAIGTAVIAVVALVAFGQPATTSAMQTGPRGSGMSVTKFDAMRLTPDPGIAALAEIDTGEDIVAAMRAWTGIPTLFEDDENYQTQVAYQMIAMTQNINANWDGHVNANKTVGVTCYTCHRGEPVPTGIWFDTTPVVAAMAGWSAVQNRATSVSQSTSLPSDALQKYLVEGETIAVHALESREAGVPGIDLPSIQNTERTYALINYIDNSLGVNCVFCHNSRAFYDGTQVTPQWGTASLGIQMVQELNNDYLIPVADLLPAERLGPVNGDGPKVGCQTCHKGHQQPLQGTNVIDAWPQLAEEGAIQVN